MKLTIPREIIQLLDIKSGDVFEINRFDKGFVVEKDDEVRDTVKVGKDESKK